jgi:hypothetical protein
LNIIFLLLLLGFPFPSQTRTMLFPEEDAPLLKTWIVKRIENTFVCPQLGTRDAPS